MESLVIEFNKTMEEVMSRMEVLEGTEYEECINEVRILLSNRLEDLKT